MNQATRLPLGEGAVAFLERGEDIQDQLAFGFGGDGQLVALAHQQGADSGHEGFGLPSGQGLRNLGLDCLDILLEFLILRIVDPFPAPGEVGFQGGKPQGPQAGDQFGRDLGDGFEGMMGAWET